MRAISVATATLLTGAATLALATPAALADDGNNNITSFGFSVSPSTVAPGGTVTLSSDGCEVPTVSVSSGVFDTVQLNEGRPATAKVDQEAKVGAQYEVTFDCNGEKGTTQLTIAEGVKPAPVHKGVKAGLGGAVAGSSPAELAAGTALIAGALGGGVWLMRRRTSPHA
ncbi:hypothetical protein ACFQLX_21895 [Streptomyces polyrhachis]|uniref:Lipoprotein n=1 Tax=Streptomyces polyrhachis TaxID=1282885 RepID=A0ABW2GMQ7_9ACTN